MTDITDNKEVQGINASQNELLQWLESELWALISDQSSGLSDLASFSKNLTKNKSEKPLTKHNLHLIKEDLQDGGLVDFESGNRNGKQFWFEVIISSRLSLQMETAWFLSISDMIHREELSCSFSILKIKMERMYTVFQMVQMNIQ